ncbi:MAG: 5-(carboxyamino)imidazole ribonucleotide synthase [Gammaproteobacteria bacterium]|nr:5-(carboxyamino)imidazole ribonucleotide synthase [Gammaproteobacteria bacterium]MBU1645677.1 5-(carboxyamino)imidazole ribonucleotide synthase [Gammaproteobacteria bacterium]MBU1970782.1 5-(carboxyamino)imidazole ribonucleotide synthase [Gammaproteobacteria bacterium]
MIAPPATLGMLGGGQLGRFFVIAAHEMGYKVAVLDPDPHSPAGRIADHHLIAAWDDADALDRMAGLCAAVTTEFENVPADTLAYLSKFVPVRPGAEAVAICQNRSAEKGFLKQHGFPHAPCADIRSESDIRNANAGLFPGILKVARFGYDGKGQSRVRDREEALTAFGQMKGEPCVLEQMLPLDYELSVVLARDEHGMVKCFPTAENSHSNGILDVSIVPARASGCLRGNAEEIAEGIAQKMGYVGTLAVEFFVVRGQLHVNEMAPRPHNSGHYTIDACVTDQFEQQVRALCGLPLGDARAHSAAVMVNLLGDIWYRDDPHHAREPDWAGLLAVPNLKLHLYGKHHPRHGRKMGHFTVIGADADEVQKSALAARRRIGICDE